MEEQNLLLIRPAKLLGILAEAGHAQDLVIILHPVFKTLCFSCAVKNKNSNIIAQIGLRVTKKTIRQRTILIWRCASSLQADPRRSRKPLSAGRGKLSLRTVPSDNGSRKKRAPERSLFKWLDSYYSMISVTTPEATVLPPSRIAKRRPSSIAIGVISSTLMTTLSPGMHISVPSGRDSAPVTSVVLK